MSQDAWVASLSDGTTVVEHWIENEPSPWLRLMDYCNRTGAHITTLRLTICSKTIMTRPRADGYWQMHQRTILQGYGEVPLSRGIGFVEGDRIKIIWGVRTQFNTPHFWSEERSIEGQGCIIWKSKPVIHNN